ncbi:LysR family transcriptional regulator [Jingyaoa shaoxingensis]|uniref:LysR family transcriptional regulator n=1 Tax=Jingyaoa shaoxingensis TaxID=2763671 RepID=A0ABR7N6K9_9FIRM|nr:LysR family transcriptional regulator [Jingyaoa shaoxingensis]MBC8571780.1 LysR family transcriptional regulator [Jingyaoa shaoxingensis]
MNIENLKTFITLSELKNFTQTADRYFIVQSTVTNRIMELEKELGKKLFIRNRKNVELTEEGQHFLAYAKRIVALEASAIEELSMLHTFSENLRIGTVNTVYDCYLIDPITAFVKNHKDISVKVIVDHTGPLLRMLQDGTVDVAFCYAPLKKAGFICKPFMSDDLLLVTSPDHTEHIDGITQSQLAEIGYLYCDFIVHDNGTFIRDLFPKNFAFSFEIDKLTHLPHYLMEGIGYTFLPRSLVQPYLDNGSLISIPLKGFEAPEVQSFVIIPEGKADVLSIERFLQVLPQENAQKEAQEDFLNA